MKIAVVNNFYPPRVGGSAHLSESLAKGYAAAGHEVLVITAAHAEAPSDHEVDGVRIVRFPAFRMPETRLAVNFDIAFTSRPSLPRRMKKVLDEFKPDVIHQHGQFFDLTWASGLWARKNNVPTLLSVHTRLQSPSRLYQAVFNLLDRFMVAPFMRRYKPTYVVMDVHMQEYIEKKYKRSITGMVPIPVGVDPEWVRGGDPVLMRDKHELGDAPIILSTGHVIPLRDRLGLVEALPEVLREVPDAKLVVVGGIYFDAFLHRARELGVEKAVVTTGAVPKADIPHYLAAANVECHELQGYGFGTASLESMAAGVPVVAAVREDNFLDIKLVDRGNVHLVDTHAPDQLAERLIETIKDPAESRDIAEAAVKLVNENFAMSAVIAKHIETLQGLVSGTAG
ncbi:Glycosyltransferase involved in cell wall bisynthesis [Amycolatopsis xylanica]|uniref:Glycosyltransferase involved in cell wall bisynthesis n=1 Tax=Amycolatopsis xylanica TaxID=589385 RepID=A0A1H3SU69_9PSEU|nr:glycosyltransferase family 4 protein [Amycolatopsis xylanica]SDZ41081.1 Glycosyltransferase involved in cell wall bisynthesis [Amycolatopsis xylanica]